MSVGGALTVKSQNRLFGGMNGDRPEDRSETSERNVRPGRMTTQFDPALRTDRRALALLVGAGSVPYGEVRRGE